MGIVAERRKFYTFAISLIIKMYTVLLTVLVISQDNILMSLMLTTVKMEKKYFSPYTNTLSDF